MIAQVHKEFSIVRWLLVIFVLFPWVTHANAPTVEEQKQTVERVYSQMEFRYIKITFHENAMRSDYDDCVKIRLRANTGSLIHC